MGRVGGSSCLSGQWRAVSRSPRPEPRSRTRTPITGSQNASAAVAELQQLLLATDDITDFLHELALLAVSALDGDIWCGITLRRDHRAVTVASSDERAARVDEVQYAYDQGPCLTSLRTGEIVLVVDLLDDDRWGEYRSLALTHGVRASLSLPLGSDGTVVGALNLYSGKADVFDEEHRRRAVQFATEASRALALAVRIAERTEMSAQLQEALASRAVIDQALGIVMAQRRCTVDEAFDTLRTVSQNSNTKVRDVAARLVATVSGQLPSTTARYTRSPASGSSSG